MQRPERKETNREFAKNNDAFMAACVEAGVETTSRQASKFRLGKGKAYQKGRVKK